MRSPSVPLLLLVALNAGLTRSRANSAAPPLRLSGYLTQVGRANLELAARRLDLPIAQARIAMARVFPDPSVTAGVAADVTRRGAPTVESLGLAGTIELGGKRSARIAVAESARAGAQAELDDFFRNLRAAAAGSFIDALADRLGLEQKRRTLASLEKLVAVNEQRLRAGDVGEVEVAKSRVEAQRFRSEVLDQQGAVAAADLALLLHLGAVPAGAAAVVPVGDLRLAPRSFDVEALVAAARRQRPDVVAARIAVETATAQVGLTRANRRVDLSASLGWQHSTPGKGDFEQPAFEAFGATLGVPLPFSRIWRGELEAAQAGRAQAELQLAAAELRAEVEVRQAAARYQAQLERVAAFRDSALADADRVFESTMYTYQRGGATLLEVLDAQRIVNEVYLAYYDALRDCAHALVTVEQAAGIWDIDL